MKIYNPLPHLPQKFQKIIYTLKSKKTHPRLIYFALGLLSTIWFLMRVIPKPSRAGYPCMQASAPFMTVFVLYLMSLGGTVFVFKAIKRNFVRSNYFIASLFVIAALEFYLFSQTQLQSIVYANKISKGLNSFTPNAPIGVAQGIFPE